MKRLNLVPRAIQSLQDDLEYGHRIPHVSLEAHTTRWLIHCLKESVKFLLPDGSSVLEQTDVSRAMELVRLPYPIIAVEFKVDGVVTRPEVEVPSSERIALCIAPSSRVLDDSKIFHTPLPTRDDADGIYVMSIYCVDGAWFVPPCIAFVRSTEEKVRFDGAHLGHIDSQRFGQAFYLFALHLDRFAKSYLWHAADFNLVNAIASDMHDEVQAAVALCKLLNCTNVSSEVIPAPQHINAQRARKNKLPLYEYRVLTIEAPAEKSLVPRSASESGRASPRQHLRRGHIRRVADKIVWVNAAVIGSHGRIEKAYRVKGGRHVA